MPTVDFLNPWFLLGAPLALVPIVLHLVQRRRRQRVVFGSVRFLRRMSHRVVRRRRLTELLLILLRTLALALLVLAFARPFFYAKARRAGGATVLGEQAVPILIDNSYSMQHADRLARAKAAARKLIASADPLTRMGLAEFSTGLRVLCPLGAEADRLLRTVDAIKPSWRGTDLALALEQANRQLAPR